MMVVKKGDKVKVEYEGRFEDGTVFDSSKHGDHSHPLEFEVGSGQVIKGFDDAVVGMEKDEEKEITLKSEEAYGEARDDLKKDVPKTALPEGQEPKEGMVLIMNSPDGRQIPVKIAEVKDEAIVVDFNHPLAGRTLIFKFKIVEINSK